MTSSRALRAVSSVASRMGGVATEHRISFARGSVAEYGEKLTTAPLI